MTVLSTGARGCSSARLQSVPLLPAGPALLQPAQWHRGQDHYVSGDCYSLHSSMDRRTIVIHRCVYMHCDVCLHCVCWVRAAHMNTHLWNCEIPHHTEMEAMCCTGGVSLGPCLNGIPVPNTCVIIDPSLFPSPSSLSLLPLPLSPFLLPPPSLPPRPQ